MVDTGIVIVVGWHDDDDIFGILIRMCCSRYAASWFYKMALVMTVFSDWFDPDAFVQLFYS